MDWYTARIENYRGMRPHKVIPDNVMPHVVARIPRWAVKFANGKYQNNQSLMYAFRHPMGMPEDMYPQSWIDGKGSNNKNILTANSSPE